jgi:hypothetical protein
MVMDGLRFELFPHTVVKLKNIVDMRAIIQLMHP